MTFVAPVFHLPGIVAGADLRTHQFKFVKLDSSGNAVLASVAGEGVIGVLQNKPNVGEAAQIMTIGVTRIIAAASQTLPAFICTDANAKAVVSATSGHERQGYLIEASGGADAEVSAYINCGNSKA